MSAPSSFDKFSLPLVSIIITNYNYANFLPEALASVESQTYPNIECIVVDDKSSDGSAAVLDAIAARRPDVKIVRKQTNEGQTAAFVTGFMESTGEYVLFLDADDALFPECVETHVFTQMSLRFPVGFTSADLMQSAGDRLVTSTIAFLSDYVASGKGKRTNLIRRIDEHAPRVWPLDGKLGDDFAAHVHFVHPEYPHWVFAPTSGNCFRRDALALVLRNPKILNLRHNADTYLVKVVCLLCGAALIDIPLGVYRLHGGNGFANQPNLYTMHSFASEKLYRADYEAWRAIACLMLDEAELFYEKLDFNGYRRVLVTLQRFPPKPPAGSENLAGYIPARLRAEERQFQKLLGEQLYADLLAAVERGSVAVDRPAPPVFFKLPAELCLTLGRLLHAPALTEIGERLWRA